MKTIIILIAALSFTAAAEGYNSLWSGFNDRGQGNAQGDSAAAPSRGLTFEDLKVACQNPAKFHAQVAPSNIQVTCSDVQNRWVPDADGAFEMGNSRHITASIYSDKYTVSPQSSPIAISSQVSSCPQFKEVSEAIEVARAVTCDEIVAFAGTGIDFCSYVADSVRAANKGAIRVTETGRQMSLCGHDKGGHGQRGEHGQGRGQN